MNDLLVIGLDVAVMITGIVVLLAGLWLPRDQQRVVAQGAAFALAAILAASFGILTPDSREAFGGMYVLDTLALYFKRFFLLTGAGVLLVAAEDPEPCGAGFTEYCALTLWALGGMMFAASAQHFALVFVALELITVTFYVLVGFRRTRLGSLEAGVKYLILGALSSAFLVYGIALVFGATGTLSYGQLAHVKEPVLGSRLLHLGLLLVLVGIGFKVALVPMHVWVPDVYQGAPTPTTAFLAVGSKAAGVALLIRLLYGTVPGLAARWQNLLILVGVVTIVYGVLGAIPQVNLKRLLGYSSIANAGYLMLGLAAVSRDGLGAILFYLAGYLVALMAVFLVLALVARETADEDLSGLANLHHRSPFLAGMLALGMVSVAGIPPLAGFFGKFLLFRSALAQGSTNSGLYVLVGVALFGVVVSLYYYLGVLRALYWPPLVPSRPVGPVAISGSALLVLATCLGGLFWLGVFPGQALSLADHAVRVFQP